ncbi:MAG TPA: hypothetical protein VHC18_11395 [Amycolatopsis sp.]|nr:hypothetical protein [Amycolatopsis sp.]
MTVDWSSGMPDERETIVPTRPDIPFWSENLLFALYDPTSDIGLWLHLGTVPNDWGMWEDRAYVCLPGDDGVLSMVAYHRTPEEQRPAGANLAFRCLEPWRRWRVSFDGFGLHTSNKEMTEGRARVGPMQPFSLDLDVEMAVPAWDAHAAAEAETGQGSMRGQGWATHHYEQLYRANGTVALQRGTHDFHGFGWRDHSRGPRGGNTGAPWGGHVITGTLYPDSGRAWGLSRYWGPDGAISLEGGYVVDADGTLHHARVTTTPRLEQLTMDPETLPIGLEWPGGKLDTTIVTRRSLWLAMAHSLAVGKELSGNGLMYVLNHGTSDWDGEAGQTYLERSDPLNAFPPRLGPAEV